MTFVRNDVMGNSLGVETDGILDGIVYGKSATCTVYMYVQKST